MIEQLKTMVVLFVFLFVAFGVGVLVGLKLPENESYQRWHSANKAMVEKARPTDVAVMQMPGSTEFKNESVHSGSDTECCPGGVCKLPPPNVTSGHSAAPPKKKLNLTFYETLSDKPTESSGSALRIKTAPVVAKKKVSSGALKSEKQRPETGSMWEVRICSLAQEIKARLERGKLIKAFPEVDIEAVQVAGKGTWYRVKISNIKDRGEAERYQQELIRDYRYKPIIIKQ
ncbi:MAG: SPOR domain-containing protein [Deltaproteobacteria bacterium]|nr:SPOR domain-containing protein [Candidatus Tharpella sp.]